MSVTPTYVLITRYVALLYSSSFIMIVGGPLLFFLGGPFQETRLLFATPLVELSLVLVFIYR